MSARALAPELESGAIRQALIALSCAGFLVNLDRAVFSPLLPVLARDLHATIPATGLAVTCYVIPYGLFQLVYGPLGDRFGKVAVVRWAVLLFALGTGLCGAAVGLPMLDALRAAAGACAAAVIPLALAYIGDGVPYTQRQSTVAGLMTFNSLGNVLGTALGGIVGSFLSWRVPFALSGLGALAVAFLLFQVPAAASHHVSEHPSAWSRYRAVLALGRARHLYVLVGLEGLFVTGGFTYLGAFLRERFAISYVAIGLILACYAGGTVLTSRYVLRRHLRKIDEARLVFSGGLCLAAGFLCLIVLHPPAVTPLPILVMGIGFALFHSTLQTRATELLPGLRGTAVALFAFALFLGGGLGTAVLGLVLAWSGYPLLLAICGLGMLAVTVYARLVW